MAFHRLKAFGFITVTSEDRATITEQGKQALRLVADLIPHPLGGRYPTTRHFECRTSRRDSSAELL